MVKSSRVLLEAAFVLYSAILFSISSSIASVVFLIAFFEVVYGHLILTFMWCQEVFFHKYCSNFTNIFWEAFVNNSNSNSVFFRHACHTNLGADKKCGESSLYIFLHLLQKFSITSANTSVLLYMYRLWYSSEFCTLKSSDVTSFVETMWTLSHVSFFSSSNSVFA